MKYGYSPYVPVAKRRKNTLQIMNKLRKKGVNIQPVEIEGRKITKTFWGNAWCQHIESFSDYGNRLPRGRTYVRNGSVCHLSIEEGVIEAIVSGSEIYKVNGTIKPLAQKKWKMIKTACIGHIGSMLELLQGKFSDNIMAKVTDPKSGLFPQVKEIEVSCNCPDWAGMCKHIAAVLYGIGARLDMSPELLFKLRSIDHSTLISAEFSPSSSNNRGRKLKGSISDVFGIELDTDEKVPSPVKKVLTKKSSKNTVANLKGHEELPTFTVAAVKRLRKKLQMNKSQFAALLNTSGASVSRWETGKGKLALRDTSRRALLVAQQVTADEAWEKITAS
ncbi:MAG: SWIM zinc finger family protein [Gammaproteobacteria bacterium]|nr:SWIM zinc finger family protein [Gammaproteobacteria bacterium]